MDTLGIESLATGQLKQGPNNVTANFRGARFPGHAKVISATCNFYIEAAFYLSQMLVKLSAKISQPRVIGGFQDNFPGNLNGVQGLVVRPLFSVAARTNAALNERLEA